MPKRSDNIYKRKDGRWEGRYKVGSYEDGRTKYRSVYGITYTETKDKLKSIRENAFPINKTKKEKRFCEVLELWLANNRIGLKGSTEHKYRYMIDKHIIPDLGDKKVSHLSACVINSYLDNKIKNGRLDKKGGLSPSYVKTMMLIIKSTISFAAEEKMCLPLNSTISKPALRKKELPILTKDEQRKFEAYLSQGLNPTKLGILISLHTGLRIGEICALAWDDIDLKASIIHVRHTISRVGCEEQKLSGKTYLTIDTPKTQSSMRDIPISSGMAPYLERMYKNAYSKYVVSDSCSFVSPRTYEYRYHKLLQECGITSINYHALRHTFATRCVEAGVDVKSLSEILGHSNVSITLNTYVHSSMEQKRMQMEKLSSLSA